MPEPVHVVRNLEHALTDDDFAWSLLLVGEDQTDKLATLTGDLRGPFSDRGDGKQVTSGFSYWGIGPTIAWAHACSDPFYLVMKTGTDAFARHWRAIRPHVQNGGFHLVSLGIGTGLKDRTIVDDLRQGKPDLFYIPVDMSSEMLRLGVQEITRGSRLGMAQVLPVQIDFSLADNVDELRQMLTRLVGEDPILYSLTGNTLANFDRDDETLEMLAQMLRPQDRLLLEVATTTDLSQQAADDAADEYHQTRAFTEFVTSALRYNTDLTIANTSVKFRGFVEHDDTLLVKIMYQNDTGEPVVMGLPDHTEVTLPVDDTIRLYTTRKFSAARLDKLVAGAGLELVESAHTQFRQTRRASPFGLDLLLLAPKGAQGPRRSVADEMWART